MKERRQGRKNARATGRVCTRCGKNTVNGLSTSCSDCQRRDREAYRIRKNELQSKGLCTNCGQRHLHTKSLCEICLTVTRERKSRLVSQGRCADCGRTHDGKTSRCLDCYTTKKRANDAYIERRTKQGRCVVCGTEDSVVPATLATRPHCESCCFKRTAHNATGKWSQGPLLRELFEKQGRRCAYTGRPLELGVNASLDHKLPRSSHPELRADPNNLHWVDASINSMKHDMTHDEFLSICAEVSRATQCK